MRFLLFIYIFFSACHPKQIIDEKTKPNVLILFTDDQSWNTIHAWGNNEINTPNMDRLAKMGTSFTRAHVLGGNHGAICAFSRAMLLTGRPFWNIPKSFANPTTGECPYPTMPEVFKENGYKTFFTGKWHNRPPELVAGFDEGKNIFLGGMHFQREGGHFKPNLFDELDKTGKFLLENKKQKDEFSSKLYADATIEFIEKQEGTAPFFIYTSFTSPHDPRTPPPPYDIMYDPAKIKLPPNFMPYHPFKMGVEKIRDEVLLPYPRTEKAVRKEIALYYGMISEVDAQIGRILDALGKKGLLKNTIIVFAGDNGLAAGQHGLLGKQNLYDHSVRIPLIIAGPNVPKNKTANTLCSIHDIFPTLSDLSGINKPLSIEGQSLLPVINNPSYSIRKELLLSYTVTQRALRTADDWKLILTKHDEKEHAQLFNLTDDPWELNDLSNDNNYFDKFSELNNRIQANLFERKDDFFAPKINIEYLEFGFPPMVNIYPPDKNMEVRYTLDGTNPTPLSPLANGQINISKKTTIYAQTYYLEKPVSPIISEEIGIPDKFAKLILSSQPAAQYAGYGAYTLADGIRGTENFHEKKWLGFNGDDCHIELDLGSKKDISKIKIGYLSNSGSWIFPPKHVKVISTQNREHFMTECEWGTPELKEIVSQSYIGEVEINCNIKDTRILKIIVENIGVCPEWHTGNGQKAWLFLDEISIE